MTRVIKLSKGLDINLAGKAEPKKVSLSAGNVYALNPADFEGVKPKVVVKEGDIWLFIILYLRNYFF